MVDILEALFVNLVERVEGFIAQYSPLPPQRITLTKDLDSNDIPQPHHKLGSLAGFRRFLYNVRTTEDLPKI